MNDRAGRRGSEEGRLVADLGERGVSRETGTRHRLLPPVYVLAAFILMVGLHMGLPGAQILDGPLRYAGLPLLVAALALVLWAASLFRKAGTTLRPFEEPSALVLDGPYRWSRNPIYVGMVGALLGIALMLGSASPFLVVPLFAALIDVRFIRAEEAVLEKSLGAAYGAYKARVRRWL